MELNTYTELFFFFDNQLETVSIRTITLLVKVLETLGIVKTYLHTDMTITNYCTHLSGYIFKCLVWLHSHKSILSNPSQKQ